MVLKTTGPLHQASKKNAAGEKGQSFNCAMDVFNSKAARWLPSLRCKRPGQRQRSNFAELCQQADLAGGWQM